MRLIDADMLRDRLREIAYDKFNLSDEYGWFIKGLLAADDEIRWFPNAQEIIRCGECRHRRSSECPFLAVWVVQSDDWFCADGKRKEDETN